MEKTFFLTASSPVYLQLGFVFLLRFLVPVSIPCGLLYKSLTLIQIRLSGFPLEDAALGWTVPSLQYDFRGFLQHTSIVLYLFQDIFREQNVSGQIFGKNYVQILEGRQRRLEKQQVGPCPFDSWMQLGYVSKCSAAIVHFLQPYSSSNCVQCHLNLGIQPQLSGTSTMDDKRQGAGPDLFPLWLITHSLFCFFITCLLHCQTYDGYSPDFSTWQHLAEHSACQGAEPCHGVAAFMDLAQFRQGYTGGLKGGSLQHPQAFLVNSFS